MAGQRRIDDRVRGVVATVCCDGRWLMIQRAAGIKAGGAWCFPGGAVEEGETEPQALRREMWEELGVLAEPGACIWRWRRDDGGLELGFFDAALHSDAPRPNPAEVADVRWMSADQIRRLHNVLSNNLAFLDFVERNGS